MILDVNIVIETLKIMIDNNIHETDLYKKIKIISHHINHFRDKNKAIGVALFIQSIVITESRRRIKND